MIADGAPMASYGKMAPLRAPKGGWKVQCRCCRKILKTRPDLTKSMCAFIARANGWKASQIGRNAFVWRCPKCGKTTRKG